MLFLSCVQFFFFFFIKHQRNMHQVACAIATFQGRILRSLSLQHSEYTWSPGGGGAPDLAGREHTDRNGRGEETQGYGGGRGGGLLVGHWWETGEKAKCFSTISWDTFLRAGGGPHVKGSEEPHEAYLLVKCILLDPKPCFQHLHLLELRKSVLGFPFLLIFCCPPPASPA